MSTYKKPKVKYRRTKEELKAPVHRKWGRVWDATNHVGVSKSELYKILRDPESGVRSFVYKAGADKRSGCRMIYKAWTPILIGSPRPQHRSEGKSMSKPTTPPHATEGRDPG